MYPMAPRPPSSEPPIIPGSILDRSVPREGRVPDVFEVGDKIVWLGAFSRIYVVQSVDNENQTVWAKPDCGCGGGRSYRFADISHTG